MDLGEKQVGIFTPGVVVKRLLKLLYTLFKILFESKDYFLCKIPGKIVILTTLSIYVKMNYKLTVD